MLRVVLLFAMTNLALAQSANELVSRAQQVSGLNGTGPFKLTAGIFHKKDRLGTYQLWRDKDMWRDELVTEKFFEKRVGRHDSVWIQRSPLDSWTPLIFEIREIMPVDYTSWSASAKRTVRKKLRGEKVSCIDYDDLAGTEMCFSDSYGTIAGNAKYAFADFAEFNGKSVPRKITDGDQTIVIETLEKLEKPLSTEIGTDFKGPIPGCYQPNIPLIKDTTIHPHYPEDAKNSRAQGTAMIYTVIDSSGAVTGTYALAGGNPIFAATSRFAIQHWKYLPAMCGSVPVPYEKIEVINFTLSP